jgi:hypothetical protein
MTKRSHPPEGRWGRSRVDSTRKLPRTRGRGQASEDLPLRPHEAGRRVGGWGEAERHQQLSMMLSAATSETTAMKTQT